MSGKMQVEFDLSVIEMLLDEDGLRFDIKDNTFEVSNKDITIKIDVTGTNVKTKGSVRLEPRSIELVGELQKIMREGKWNE